jgi:terminase large subunit-like protein
VKATSYTYRRPSLYPKQHEALFCPERYALVEATTKSGKTVGSMAWLLEQALERGGPGRNFWWVAPIYAQARIPFRRMKRGLPAEVYVANDTELTLTLFNGAVLWFKGADKPDSLYGDDVWDSVIDEASRCKEEAWHAVRSTLTATRGRCRMIGNVKGRKNWFYTLCRKAEDGAPDTRYTKITAADAVAAGILDAAEIRDAESQLPHAVFRELYFAEPSDDEGNPFGIAAIRRQTQEGLSATPPDAWGWDLAKSVDWTVGIGLDSGGHTCRFARFQKPWEETFRTILAETGDVRANVDSTGVGDPILERLQRGRSNFEGYHFTAPSKQKLMEGLAVAIQQGEVWFPKDSAIQHELEAFEYVYSRSGVHYSAPEGLHDDCVCALALAVARRARSTWNWGGAS